MSTHGFVGDISVVGVSKYFMSNTCSSKDFRATPIGHKYTIIWCPNRKFREVNLVFLESQFGMDPTKLVITYGGKWVENFYEGGETEFVKVRRNLTYAELSMVVQGIANVDLSRHVPEVYVSVVEKFNAEPGDVGVHTVQPVCQSILQQLVVQFQSAGGSNNIWGSIPTTDSTFEIPSVNPVISEDGLDDFDKDYISPDGSREGMNDEAAHCQGMSSDRTNSGPDPTDGGPTGSGTAVPRHWIIPGASNNSFELVITEESSSCNRLSKCGMFENKKDLKRALLTYELKAHFEIPVTRLSTTIYEAGCKELECKFQICAVKMEGGNYWIVRIFDEDHSSADQQGNSS
ncbi:hypothetical protein Dsin_013448 [Dipteronia sinensis]|uniref:Transposase MuDR plant domain-containing protein n=1 Tax=Dipteronia sinensis TaxID=43782 RepID=A0AAE0AK00_9ROSI|nr:hypothetical protein Dsin_013448 [Dipteronia sinensis]